MKLPATVRKLLGLGVEERSITGLPWDVGGPVSQGPVTSEQALSLVPVFAAVRILAAQIASLPLQSFRKVGDQRTKIPTPSLFSAPSVIGTQFDWIHRCVTSMALRGNAYGLITQRNSLGYPTMIEWLHPDHVQVQDKSFSGPGSFTDPIWYWRGRTVPAEQMVHIPWFTVPYRVKGLSPMEACAAAVLTGVSAQDYTANWFLNGAVPPGVFKNLQKLVSQTEAEEIKSRLTRAIKTRQPLVHGNDWDYSPIAVAAHEAKFIETLKLTATQIANIYGVPPDQVGGDAGASGMTYRNENNSGLDFVKYTLRSWLEPLEEKFSGLLPQPQFVKFNLDAILRADLPTRMASYVEARNIGIMNVDEIRAKEDLPPLPDGKGQDYTPLLVQIAQSRGVDAAQVKADQAPATPEVTEPTRLRAIVGIDDAEVLEIDAGPKGEALRGASAAVALEARRNDPADPAAMRAFNPNEPRIPGGPHGGEWGGGAVGHLVKDIAKAGNEGPKDWEWDGRGEPWSKIESDYGDTIDEHEFTDDGATVGFHHDADSDSSQIVVSWPGSEKNRYSVFAVMDPADAHDWATQIEEMLDVDPDDEGYSGGANANGLVDWTLRDGALVGVDPAGDIRLGIPNGKGTLDEVDLSREDAESLAEGLHAMADASDNYDPEA